MIMFGKYVSEPVSSLEAKIFELREDVEQLNNNKGDILHSVLEKLLFLMKMSRPDLGTAVGFLMAIFSKIDVNDWERLRRVVRLFHFTLKERSAFVITNIHRIFTC